MRHLPANVDKCLISELFFYNPYYITHLHLCDGATYYTEVCEEEMLYNRGLNRWAYKTAYFASYTICITHETI